VKKMKEFTTLVFDWGDTLMKVFPQYNGPMAEWPEVAAVEGAQQALANLHQKYRILVATNAADSSAALIQTAFARVGLDPFIDATYTVHELGSRKPDPAFYRSIEKIAGQPASQMVMIGDRYADDISSAWQTGWHTLWFNPDFKPAPGLLPVQSAEISHLADLPAALERPFLPGLQTCLAYMFQEGTSANLMQHVQLVAAISYQMALWLLTSGQAVNPLLAHRGGLLHDLAKLSGKTSSNPEDHGKRAASILEAYHQPEIAQIARRHILFTVLDRERKPLTWEQKAVYLADKWVEEGRVVSLEQRLTALQHRYPQHKEEILKAAPAIRELQAEIGDRLGLSEGQLIHQLQQAVMGKPPESG
jgi:putative nucleotidyltransferase with HDIG domain